MQNWNYDDASLRTAEKQLEIKIRQSQRALLIERIWPRLWWPASFLALFMIISLTGFWQGLPYWFHRMALAFFGLGFILSFVPVFLLKWPLRNEAIERLEKTAKLKHRPLSSYEDTLSGGTHTPETQRLWRLHLKRLAGSFAGVRKTGPRPRTELYDPYALRVIVILILAVAAVSTGNLFRERLTAAFHLPSATDSVKLRLDAWITPPDYTGKPPILLADGGKAAKAHADAIRSSHDPLRIPENSILVIRLNGEDKATYKISQSINGKISDINPVSDEDEAADDTRQKPDDVSGPSSEQAPSVTDVSDQTKTVQARPAQKLSKSLKYKIKLSEPSDIKIQNGLSEVASWSFALETDMPPQIKLSKPVATTTRNTLHLTYQISDDYGVIKAEASISPQKKTETFEQNPDRPLGDAPVFALNIPSTKGKKAELQMYQDLTAHPWAGLAVEMTLSAQDHAGQETRSEPYQFNLPARSFSNPLAKAIVEQRRRLVERPFSNRETVRNALNALSLSPEIENETITVYLNLRSAFWRLLYDKSRSGAQSTAEQLWATALQIEDGNLSEAEKNLRDAQKNLTDALANNASDAEIQEKIQALREALARFLSALAHKNQTVQSPVSPFGTGPNQFVSPQDLDNMLKAIENLAKSGSKDMANRMLSELQNMLENLQTPDTAQNAESQKKMMSMMNALSDLITKQQKLLDETYQAQSLTPDAEALDHLDMNLSQKELDKQAAKEKQAQKKKLDDLMQRQDDLTKALSQLMDDMRNEGLQPSDHMGKAGQSMNNARQALQNQDAAQATQQQTLALDLLRKGAQNMTQKLMQQMGRQYGRGQRDPLGRSTGQTGADATSDVKIPDEIDIQQAREILEELRKRYGEPTRSPVELDYLERLLKRF